MKKLIWISIVSVIACAFFFGVYYGEKSVKPIVAEVPSEPYYVYIEVTKPIVQIKEVEKVVEVERVVEIPAENSPELNNFKTPEELKAWLADDTTSEIPSTILAGDITIQFYCMNYAQMLQREARQDGYNLNIQIFSAGQLPMSDRILNNPHALNSAIIGNEIWSIEPSTDEAWMAYRIREMQIERLYEVVLE